MGAAGGVVLMQEKSATLKMLVRMGIFGTVGLFVRLIPLPSANIAFWRGVMGGAFLLAVMLLTGIKPDFTRIKANLPVLCLSGAAIGCNWILLFEAYRHTTVATATACYYLAPVFLLFALPILGERLTGRKLACVLVALIGMLPVSGILQQGIPKLSEITGVLYGVGAAVLYATVMLLNQKLKDISAYDKTTVQLLTAAVVILPYMLLRQSEPLPQLQWYQWALLAVVGIVHTGVAYWLYFGAMGALKAQSVAILSYLDPVIAIVLSALVLREKMDGLAICGTVLILASAFVSQLPEKKVSRKEI